MPKIHNDKYYMNLEEKLNMVAMSMQAIIQDYKKSRLITGCLEESTKINIKVSNKIYNKIIQNRNN